MKCGIQQILQGISLFAWFVCISADTDITKHPNFKLLNQEQCGISAQLAERIIGGTKASLGQYPWIARLGFSLVDTGEFAVFNCGGALINERYVLSAAHCVMEEPKLYVSVVRLGENYADTDIDCFEDICAPPFQDIKPEAVIPHEKFSNPYQLKNDILLIRLEKPAEYNDFVMPICLPVGKLREKNFMGKRMEVAGWGVVNSTTGAVSEDLLYVNIAMKPLEKCQRLFGRSTTLGPGQMCFGGVVDKDSCDGDSGGPLMKVEAVDGPPKYFLFGVVSFGPQMCGRAPAVYTSVIFYFPWILDHIKP